MSSPYPNLPQTTVGWQKAITPAQDAYWKARREGKSEADALLAALDAALSDC